MVNIKNHIHLVQTPQWNTFKEAYGNKVASFEDVYFLVKKIPFINKYMGYAPKVNFEIQSINWDNLKKYCIKNNIAFIRFDVPNILKTTEEGEKWNEKLQQNCVLAPRNTFTKKDILLDLTPSVEELMQKMHSKKRYNIRYAQKNGVVVKVLQTEEAFNNFWKLHSSTARRQKFLTHPKDYFYKIFTTLKDNVYFVQAEIDKTVVTSWFVIIDDTTIYYVYGGSIGDSKYNRLYPNDLVGMEVIRLGKEKNCTLLDLWGAEENKGFTEFKLRYGGELVEFLPSYDFVCDSLSYKIFNLIYESFWKLQDIKKMLSSRK